MFEIPGSDIVRVEVTEDAVNGRAAPIFHYGQPASESTAAPETSASEPELPVQRVAAAE